MKVPFFVRVKAFPLVRSLVEFLARILAVISGATLPLLAGIGLVWLTAQFTQDNGVYSHDARGVLWFVCCFLIPLFIYAVGIVPIIWRRVRVFSSPLDGGTTASLS